MVETMKAWFAKPYKGAAEMTALDWALFVGMVLIILILWRVIFSHIEAGVS